MEGLRRGVGQSNCCRRGWRGWRLDRQVERLTPYSLDYACEHNSDGMGRLERDCDAVTPISEI